MSDAKKELIRMIATWDGLLDALETLLVDIRNMGYDTGPIASDIARAEAAIRRAKGEAS